MEQLSLKSYGWKCVLGMEVFYVACLAYGSFLTGKAQELHHSLFELIPWFSWGSVGSVVWGFAYFFIIAWIFAWYIVWMHNSSLIRK
jgi:Na+/citrate or Na+/malate symporter